MLASSLLVGLAIGAGATIFGYSNLGTVNVRWSVFHIDGIPLWTVAVVPLAIVLVAGTLYHWLNGLHHFTEHMRHRRRVHELEAEVASLRAHLDQVLEMPDHTESRSVSRRKVASLPAPEDDLAELATPEAKDGVEPAKAEAVEVEAPVVATVPEPKPVLEAANGRASAKVAAPRKHRKRATLEASTATEGSEGHAGNGAGAAEAHGSDAPKPEV
jgi:hypothetical protein